MENLNESSRLAKIHSALVHKRHGVITSLIEEPAGNDIPGLFVFNALTIEATYFRNNAYGFRQEARNGSGAAFDRASALWATFGEALERYAAFIYGCEQFIYATADEIGTTAVSLNNFILFSSEQYNQPNFPFHRADPSLARNWVAASDLSSNGMSCYVPANLVYLGMKLSAPHESIGQNVSTGLSCGGTRDAAIQGGLCEVIERDAFASMWQLAYAPPRLRVTEETFCRLSVSVARALTDSHIKITLWWITADTGIPVLMAMAESDEEGLLTFGASANPNLVRAIEKSVVEALHGYVWARHLRARGVCIDKPAQIRTPGDHLTYYLSRSNRQQLAFLLDADCTIDSADLDLGPGPNLSQMIMRLKSLGYSSYCIDLTTDDVAHLGMTVVRVLVPGLQPLLFGDQMASGDLRRLQVLARYWGINPFPKINEAPHPFP